MKENLYIPQGLKKRREYFDGFGKQELIYMIFSVIAAGVVAYASYLLFRNLFVSMLLVLCIPTTVVVFTIKTECNISVMDQIILMIRFQKSQKYYPYIALNEWEL